jgi:hypothetical protein
MTYLYVKDMSSVSDRVFSEVCLDNRISDGIFRMDEEEHMNALRDYFLRKGITKEAAIHVTNRMVEGKFPERQAYNKDGILVTFPTPKHKANAIARGTHFDKNPSPQNSSPKNATPDKEDKVKVAPPGSKPEPGELPSEEPLPKSSEEPDEPKNGNDEDDDDDNGKSLPKSSFSSSDKSDRRDGDSNKNLEIEPPRGDEKPEPVAAPVSPVEPPAPRTPERIAAEKEVAKQIFKTDDTVLTNVANPLNINEAALNHQLNELYKKSYELGYKEAITFLTPYIKS